MYVFTHTHTQDKKVTTRGFEKHNLGDQMSQKTRCSRSNEPENYTFETKGAERRDVQKQMSGKHNVRDHMN